MVTIAPTSAGGCKTKRLTASSAMPFSTCLTRSLSGMLGSIFLHTVRTSSMYDLRRAAVTEWPVFFGRLPYDLQGGQIFLVCGNKKLSRNAFLFHGLETLSSRHCSGKRLRLLASLGYPSGCRDSPVRSNRPTPLCPRLRVLRKLVDRENERANR